MDEGNACMSDKIKKAPKFSKRLKEQIERLAKLITLNCARNTFIEDLHSGTFPGTKTGDYSDVKVVTPYGEIPWNELSRISDGEMKKLNQEIVNKIFTFLLHYQEEAPPIGPHYLWFPNDWDAAEIDQKIKSIWDRARQRENGE